MRERSLSEINPAFLRPGREDGLLGKVLGLLRRPPAAAELQVAHSPSDFRQIAEERAAALRAAAEARDEWMSRAAAAEAAAARAGGQLLQEQQARAAAEGRIGELELALGKTRAALDAAEDALRRALDREGRSGERLKGVNLKLWRIRQVLDAPGPREAGAVVVAVRDELDR